MHSKMRPKYKPTINGKEVDLDLLYQIVTSHGGWEKVNLRNEWDDLLEHFHLPRGTNGGLVIKQIYLKYLENYEKVYFLGEEGGGGGGHKDDGEDDYDDIRNRRRTASKMTSRSSTAAASPYSYSSSHHHHHQPHHQQQPGQGQLQSVLNPLSDAMREQLGLSKRNVSDYDKLILSLQSPLPNEQDMAISVCTLLCNETKHVIRLAKCPSLLTYLLAHSGVYRDCGLREVIEETYCKGRDMDLAKFWEEIYIDSEVKSLLCETYVKRIQNTLGLFEEEPQILNVCEEQEQNIESSEEGDVSEDAIAIALGGCPPLDEECDLPSNSNPEQPSRSTTFTEIEEPSRPSSPRQVAEGIKSETRPQSPTVTRPPSPKCPEPPSHPEPLCCEMCPCSQMNKEEDKHFVLPSTLARSHDSEDKVSKRVHQIALILRNLSFEEDNAEVMAHNITMLRFLLLTANCSFGSLMQNALDTISNVAKYITLHDPSKDPISSILLSSIVSGLFSEDRMKIICSLDAIRNLTRTERNEKILANLMEKKVCERLCELLTLCDIMMLIYTLECIHAISGIGESVCNEIVRVKGSVASFIALVTVEAQSYGPKGCIQMRVVETYSGNGVHTTNSVPQQPATNSTAVTASAHSTTSPSTGLNKTVVPSSTTSSNSIQAIGLRTVSGQTVVPPTTTSSQQQTSFANSPSPLCGTVAAISVSNSVQSHQQQHRPQVRISPQVMSSPSSAPGPTAAFQVLHPHSSSPLSPSSHQPRPSSPVPGLHTPVAQPQLGKPNCLPPAGPPNSPSSSITNNNHESLTSHPVQITNTTSGLVNNINHHGQGNSSNPVSSATGNVAPGAPPQVSSQSLTQQVFTPCISSENMTEEAWATAWLNGGFEQLSGTSIEEGELYRMYCVARKKHPASLLSQSQLVQCVKLVYGASVGPVMKCFGSTSLSFIEGIRPKISFQQINSVPVSNSLPTTVMVNDMPMSVATNGVINDGAHSINTSNITVQRPITPVSLAHGGGGTSSPLSPILKATLSRPPTPKSPTGPQKSRATLSKERKVKDSPQKSNSSKKKSKRSAESTPMFKQQPSGKIMSPSSSAIRSLLASKVAQRQQKKLQQQDSKNSRKPKGSLVKMNGEACLDKGEESSASSSMNSIEESESKTDPPSTLTFQGMLCNGGSSDPCIKDADHIIEVDGVFDDLANNAKVKGMLVDLLERKVSHKDTANGIVGREIRISDKGLELIQNKNSEELDGTLINETLGTNAGESQEPQKMTFYASPEVVMASETKCTALNVTLSTTGTSETTILLSGGGGVETSEVVVQSESVEISGGDGASIEGGDGYNNNANIDSNGTSGGGSVNDLFEKFCQFSDLIVVNPEQLGIGVKRSASTSENNTTAEETDQAHPPPSKKIALCVNGNDDSLSWTESPRPHPHVPGPTASLGSSSVLQNALSASQNTPTVFKTTSGSTMTINATSSFSSSSEEGRATIAVAATTNSNNQIHVPVRLVNSQNSQQISFQGRQMVIQQGQIVLSGNPQPGMAGLQIISKSSGSLGDNVTKAYILIPQNHSGATSIAGGGTVVQSISVSAGQALLSSSTANPIQGILNQLNNVRDGVPPSLVGHLPMELLDQDIPFLCEWNGCGYRFLKYQQVFMHAVITHCPDANSSEAVRCEWGANGCDPLLRKRFSIMTHLQDRHCNKQALELACYRRKNKIEPPPPPQQPAHHPGYAPNAAFHAIKRHALQYMNPKDIMEENEGPVTKSIRLTSALILRNLVNFSPQGRRIIAAHESQLSTIAMSSAESSRTVSQLLFDMSESSDV